MTAYLDSSLVIAALTEEARTELVRRWLEQRLVASTAISRWVDTEVSSALSIKVRTKAMTAVQRNEALAAWYRLRSNAIEVLTISADDFELAAAFAGRYELGLRAGDALHLAIAQRHGCSLATLDRTMAAAAGTCGIAFEVIE